MNNQLTLQAISLDLKRLAMGSYSGSTKMAERFLEEVLKREKTLETQHLPSHLNSVLQRMKRDLTKSNSTRIHEDSLMYSTIILSYVKQLK